MRVLIIEDNAESAQMMAFAIELAGHEVQAAEDGPAALAAARHFKPQVILCDIGLPGMNGYAVAAELRAMPESRNTTLVAVTGYGESEDQIRSREAGFDYHITKPVAPEALRALIGSLHSAGE